MQKDPALCLWRTRVAPSEYNRLPRSQAMETSGYSAVCRVEPHSGCRTIYTDGSAYIAGGASYAGWGAFDREGHYSSYGPLEGDSQTASGAEVRALVQLAEMAGGPVVAYVL